MSELDLNYPMFMDLDSVISWHPSADFNKTISKASGDPRLQVDFGRHGGEAQLSLAAQRQVHQVFSQSAHLWRLSART